MYYIEKSLFFEVWSLTLNAFFSFILIQLRILIATTHRHQEQGQHVVAFRVLVQFFWHWDSIIAMCIVMCLCI